MTSCHFNARLWTLACAQAVILSISGCTPSTANWYQFSMPADGYTILMPYKPELKNENGVTCYVAETKFPNRAYLIGCVEMPEGAGDPRSIGKLDVIAGAVTSNGDGTLIGQHSIELLGHPGREFTFNMRANRTKGVPAGQSIMRVYIVGSKMYMVTMFAAGLKSSDPDVVQFFNSFELTSPPAAPTLVQAVPSMSPAAPVTSTVPAAPTGPPPIPEAGNHARGYS